MKIALHKPNEYPQSAPYVLVLNASGHVGVALFNVVDEKWYWIASDSGDVSLSLIDHENFHWISFE